MDAKIPWIPIEATCNRPQCAYHGIPERTYVSKTHPFCCKKCGCVDITVIKMGPDTEAEQVAWKAKKAAMRAKKRGRDEDEE